MRALMCVGIALTLLFGVAACWAESDSDSHTIGLAVNEVAELNIVGVVGSLIIDNPTSPLKGGDPPAARSSDSTYLQYTSIVPESAPGVLKTRKIQAQITGGTVPDGTDLTVHAEVATGDPAVGVIGERVGDDEKSLGVKVGDPLAYPARDVVSGIKCGWTSTEDGAGARLFYTFMVCDWSKVHKTSSSPITVTYTLMDPS